MRLILLILLLALIPASNASILIYVSSNSSADYLSIYDNNVLNGNYTKQAPASLGYPSPNLKRFVPHPSENSTFKGCFSNDLNTPCTTQQWNNVTYETIFSSSYTPNVYYFLFQNKTPEINGSGWAGGSNVSAPQEVMIATNVMPNYDNIVPTHSSSFCRITPTDNWIRTSLPVVYGCDKSNVIDIANVPANDLPSGGASHRIAPSELAIIILKLNDYSSYGTIKYKLENLDLNKVLIKPDDFSFDVPRCGGNCGWSYWWFQSYLFFGKYDWEIDRPGKYRISAITSWGNVSYDFDVINSSSYSIVMPIDPPTNYKKLNVNFNALNQGSLSVYFDDTYQGTVSLNSTLNIPTGSSFKIMPNPNTAYVADHCTLTGMSCVLTGTVNNIQTNMTYTIYWALRNSTSGNFWYVNVYKDERPIRVFTCAGNTNGDLYTVSPTGITTKRGSIEQGLCSDIFISETLNTGTWYAVLKDAFGVTKVNQSFTIGIVTNPTPIPINPPEAPSKEYANENLDKSATNITTFMGMPAFWGLIILILIIWAVSSNVKAGNKDPTIVVTFIVANIEAAIGLWDPFTWYILALTWLVAAIMFVAVGRKAAGGEA